MIQSMTGFGKISITGCDKMTVVEIKSLNSKQLDLSTKFPFLLREKENEIRSIASNCLERGKIELLIYFDKTEIAPMTVNTELAKAYYKTMTDLSKELDVHADNDIFCQIFKMPDVISSPKETFDESYWESVREAVVACCQKVVQFREAEGAHLAKDFEKRICLIDKMVDEITPFEENRITLLKNKMENNLLELLSEKYDKNRLEQEIIYYIEKLDITEEKVRLKKHCSYFLETMNETVSNGKKLGFIVQELGREVNTIGSKCNDFNIQQIVVRMKDEVEKIKEQLANVL